MKKRNKWRMQFTHIEGNSKFHEKVRQLICADAFLKQLRCFQEVPVQQLIPSYPDSRHRYDWYIEELNVVIELHGDQHYKFTNRGNIGYADAERAFKQLQARDRAKKLAAEEAGIRYVEIPYKEAAKLNTERLKKLIL